MTMTRIDPNNPVRNGGATVGTGGGHQNFNRDEVASYASGEALGVNLNLDKRFRAGPWAGDPLPISAADTNTASGAAAVLNYAAPDNGRLHVLYGVGFSYATTPNSGALSIQSPSGTTVWGPLTVTSAGPGFMDFKPPLRLPAGQGMRIVLGPVPGTVGTISLKGRRVE